MKRMNPKFKNIVLGLVDESRNKMPIKFAYFKSNPDKKESLDFFIYCCNKLGLKLNENDFDYIKNKINGNFER